MIGANRARRAFSAGVLAGVLGLSTGPALSCRPGSGGNADAAPASSTAVGAATSASAAPAPRLGRGRVVVPGGRAFAVEVVQDQASRERGLQHRPSLPPDQGMVFLFPTSGRHRFWMYECLIPLDLIWIDSDKTVLYVEENAPFCKTLPCPDYGPDQDSLYVLELGAGVAKEAGIRPGTHLMILFDHPPDPR
jgi:hypothetical protein